MISAGGAALSVSQYLVNRPYDADPRRAAFEIFRREASLRLNGGPYRRVFTVFLDQQSRNPPTIVVLLHLPLET